METLGKAIGPEQYTKSHPVVSPLVPGNIDLSARPIVNNPDGSFSTVRSMSFNNGGREVLVPTRTDSGQNLSPLDAIRQFMRTGQHLGMFDTPENATAYALQLHGTQEQLYRNRARR